MATDIPQEEATLAGIPVDGKDFASTPYSIKADNWWRTVPYGFRIIQPTKSIEISSLSDIARSSIDMGVLPDVRGGSAMVFYFPVNPESINISTPYAVQVTPTLGGIVEEHSGAVFYNITLSGTTGILPSIDYTSGSPRNDSKELRNLVYEPSDLSKNINKYTGGFLSNTINTVNSAVSKIFGTSDKTVDSARSVNSGYTSFHVLYKFLWLYHDSKSKGSQKVLQFVNFKDNNQYNVVVQNFQLTRDKSRPHLYQYSIQLKGWSLDDQRVDAKFDQGDRLKNLGLDEGPSFKAQAFRVINTTKSTLNAAKNILNTAAQDAAF